ncbi:hypothetical protein Poli38472_004536 [Pythium oligandrum]|uniref:HTH CENPB-type domain-containing protein n=1 Tax=Pythium oligandrum TaxID=41045 RepID=A0A8K1CAA8_PYTOL|nr:hypothetical protein Poli38472_004536 [Pythium oligandrum]|eukprot:TMW59467.1 hypothetical protein Poli38472_004536 [Pythium oligandrum]
MGRRRITPPTNHGLNPAAANVPSVLAAAAAASHGANGARGKRALSSGNGNLTNHQRKIICEFYQKSGGVMSQKDLAQWTKHEFGLKKTPAQSTISGILRRQHEFINMSSLELGIKKRRVVQHPQLDNALANWVIQCAHRGITVQGDMTKEKAKHFAKMLGIPEDEQPEFSNGWLHSFQLRHNFSFRKFNGDAAQQHGVSNGMENKRVIKFTTLEALVEEAKKYELKNIFSMAEMGVLYNQSPVVGEDDTTEVDAVRAKKRLVGAFACNADASEKLQPLFISHHEQPKCFRKKSAEQHGLQYFWNGKAWVTGVIFSKWSQRLDFSMASQKRKILLIINEAPSHAVAHLELNHVVIYFLPEGMTTLNPMTSGILSTLKMRYRRHHLRHVIDRSDEGKKHVFGTNVLQAMHWACASWDEMSSETIERSWSMTQIVSDRLPLRPDLQINQEAATLEAELTHLLLFLRLKEPMPLMEFLNDDGKFETSVHEEFFEVVQAVDEVPDDDIDEDGDDPSTANLTLQEKLKAFRDVLQVLKDRNDSDDSALSAIRRVQDAIRNEARQDGTVTAASLEAAAAAVAADPSIASLASAMGLGGTNVADALSLHAASGLLVPLSMPMTSSVRSTQATALSSTTNDVSGLQDGDFHAVI